MFSYSFIYFLTNFHTFFNKTLWHQIRHFFMFLRHFLSIKIRFALKDSNLPCGSKVVLLKRSKRVALRPKHNPVFLNFHTKFLCVYQIKFFNNFTETEQSIGQFYTQIRKILFETVDLLITIRYKN